ncbi:MAG: pyrroline-5-carboxylate reductase [Bacillus sp. (in: firmicutes)]
MHKVTFIGAGSMAEAMISGITARGELAPGHISVINRSNHERLDFLHDKYKIQRTLSIKDALNNADIAVLAVKPKDVVSALTAIRPYLTNNILLLSVVAGVSMEMIGKIAGHDIAVIRSMPNTSAAIGRSATACSSNSLVKKDQLNAAVKLLETIGTVTQVKEAQLDAVTGLAGSGPAYIYYMVEAMEHSAREIGLDQKTAKELILQTLFGAAGMLQQSTKTSATLRHEVTSPGGTTEAGLKVLQSKAVQEAFIECIVEATKQSKRLGDNLASDLTDQSISV